MMLSELFTFYYMWNYVIIDEYVNLLSLSGFRIFLFDLNNRIIIIGLNIYHPYDISEY